MCKFMLTNRKKITSLSLLQCLADPVQLLNICSLMSDGRKKLTNEYFISRVFTVFIMIILLQLSKESG